MTVEKRPLGSSDIEVAPLALGGNVFGWTADEETSFPILDAFVDAGGNMIDTADVYSAWVPGHQGGESETVIGRWLKRDPSKREKSSSPPRSASWAADRRGRICRRSNPRHFVRHAMRRWSASGIETIDLYYQHKDDEAVPLADSLGAMDQLAKEGKIRSIGLSQFAPYRLTEAVRTAEATRPHSSHRPPDLVQYGRAREARRTAARCRLGRGHGHRPLLRPRQRLPDRQVSHKEDLDKSVRGLRNVEYLEGRGLRVLEALDRVAEETARHWPRSL